MKSRITKRSERASRYPKLMKSNQYIILFKESEKGTVISIIDRTSSVYQVGDYLESWHMHNFTDFDDDITLFNE